MKMLLPLVFFAFAACSIPDLKSPEYSKDEAEVIDDVRRSGGFEEVEVKWKFRSAEVDYTHHLILKLKNPSPVPATEIEWKELALDAMRAAAVSIENTVDYDFYEVELSYHPESGDKEKRMYIFVFDDLIQ